LIELDFKPGAVDGSFGVYTESAVKLLQSWANLEQDGIVGPLTWEKLDPDDKSDPTLQEGSKGVAVRGLPRMLITRELEPGEIDGRFGPKTEAAVRAYQGARVGDFNAPISADHVYMYVHQTRWNRDKRRRARVARRARVRQARRGLGGRRAARPGRLIRPGSCVAQDLCSCATVGP